MVVWHGIVLYGIYIYIYIYIYVYTYIYRMVWHGGMAWYSILYGIYIYIYNVYIYIYILYICTYVIYMNDKEMIMNISMHISTFVDAYCDIYIGILYCYRQFCVCAWRPSCIYTHTHTHPSGGRAEGGGGREGPQAVFVYMLVLFLSFPKSGIFDFIIPDFGKGILYVFVKKEPFVKNIEKKSKFV